MIAKARSMATAMGDQFQMGMKMGSDLAPDFSGTRKGQDANAGKWVSVLFGLLIFAYVASTLGPDIITQFTNNSISGAEGDIYSLGGILVAAGILAGVGSMVGLKVFSS